MPQERPYFIIIFYMKKSNYKEIMQPNIRVCILVEL